MTNNIGSYPGFKYGNVFIKNGGALRRYEIKIKLKDAYYKEFKDQPLQFFYSGPMSWKRDLQDDGVKLCTFNVTNREVRIVSTATFSAAQPDHDIGVVLIIPTIISDNPQSYIEVTVTHEGGEHVNEVSDEVKTRGNNIQSGTPAQILNKFFG